MSVKNSNDTIGNRTRDLPTCSAVPQPTALLRAPKEYVLKYIKTVVLTCDILQFFVIIRTWLEAEIKLK